MKNSYTVSHEKLTSWLAPELVFLALFSKQDAAFWLDSSLNNSSNRFSYMGAPSEIYSYDYARNATSVQNESGAREINQDIFSFLEAKLASTHAADERLPFPFIGGYVGYFGYELKSGSKLPPESESEYPDALWYFVDKFIAFDHQEQVIYLVSLEGAGIGAHKWFENVRNILLDVTQSPQGKVSPRLGTSKTSQDLEFKLTRSKKQYLQDIETCLEYLRSGESYQICLTNSLTCEASIDPLEFYLSLRSVNPAPYASFFKYQGLAIACSSPELFLKISADGTVETKPMKGTIARGNSAADDSKRLRSLAGSRKDWSENAIIVDLLRNDLGRVCEYGSVKIASLMKVESYRTVHTLVSTITGKLREDVSVIACVQACFPGGSMTGAPKTHTMQLLERIERRPRGIYSGSLGFISLNQTAALNIVIRTLVASGDMLTIGTGGAIVLESDPPSEFDEMMLKTSALTCAINR